MQDFDIIKKSAPPESFRVAAVVGKFGLQSSAITERFTGSIPVPDEWSIGMIVGASGTGKTTIARELWPDAIVDQFKYTAPAIVDDMPDSALMEDITRTFCSVGFASPPSWLKPYAVLSNGEKMRVDLARAILDDRPLIVFDEFTSVVDRNVARIGSMAIQKAIRRTNKKFIAVTCHDDIEEWLIPDWIFDTNTMMFRIGVKKNDRSKSKYSKQVIKAFGRRLPNITI